MLTIPSDGLQDYVHGVMVYMFKLKMLTIPSDDVQDYVHGIMVYMF